MAPRSRTTTATSTTAAGTRTGRATRTDPRLAGLQKSSRGRPATARRTLLSISGRLECGSESLRGQEGKSTPGADPIARVLVSTGSQGCSPWRCCRLYWRLLAGRRREGDTVSFTVTLEPANTEEVTVQFATASAIAAEGTDYTAANGTLTFEAGHDKRDNQRFNDSGRAVRDRRGVHGDVERTDER